MSANFIGVHCGAYHTFLVHESHKLFAFGLNNHGQLGVGDSAEYSQPELVEGLPDQKIVKAAGGEHHSMVLTADGTLILS